MEALINDSYISVETRTCILGDSIQPQDPEGSQKGQDSSQNANNCFKCASMNASSLTLARTIAILLNGYFVRITISNCYFVGEELCQKNNEGLPIVFKQHTWVHAWFHEGNRHLGVAS